MTRLYGCHNRAPLRSSVWVQDGQTMHITVTDGVATRAPALIEIPFRFEPECQFTHTTLGQLDARCGDCCHRTTTPKDLNAS